MPLRRGVRGERHVLPATLAAVLGTLLSGACSTPRLPQLPPVPPAFADMLDAAGGSVGRVIVEQAQRGVYVRAELRALAPGEYALHVHEAGHCQAPFTSAGAHFNPGGRAHGVRSARGMHAGDLPNIHVGSDGIGTLDAFAPLLRLSPRPDHLLDADGAAFVLHERADDYRSDPDGDAGARIACGVLRR